MNVGRWGRGDFNVKEHVSRFPCRDILVASGASEGCSFYLEDSFKHVVPP
jgi:hypothetical protein